MSGADDDYIDYDQQWFFDELKQVHENSDPVDDLGSSLDVPVDIGPRGSPPPTSSTADHGHLRQSHQQIQQQQLPQSSHHDNAYQEQQMGHMDGMMPSTSDYGMQQRQPSHIQEQQPPVSQHQQHSMQIHNQSQQQFETLQTYNPNQSNVENHYQQNTQMFDMSMDFITNEASTSNTMPMECRISQEYGIQQNQQQYHHSQSQPQSDSQWIPMESPSQMSQQNQPQMTSVVYTSNLQQMQRIPDPGGHNSNQPQMINNFNSQAPQQIIQTGINGETILTNMQPVQRIIHPSQQSFEMNSNNYLPQQITYMNASGSQQFVTSQSVEGSNNGFHQPLMQVVPQTVPIQPTPPKNEPARTTPAPKSRAKNPTKANGRKKNQPPAAAESAISKIEKITAQKAVEVKFNADAHKVGEVMAKMAQLQKQEQLGYDMTELKKEVEKQLNELLSGAQIDSKPSNVAPAPSQKAPNFPPIAPSTSNPPPAASQPTKGKKRPTKAEQQKELQQKREALSNANSNIQPQPAPPQSSQPSQSLQGPTPINNYRIISQNSEYLLVDVNGTVMKAINVKTENGTATYQILGPTNPAEQFPPQNNIPPSQPSSQQKRVQSQKSSTSYKSEIDDASQAAALAAVSDVVNSFGSGNKAKTPKKTPARSRKKAAETPATEKTTAPKVESLPPPSQPEPTVICVPSTSKEPPKPKIILPAASDLAKRVKEKTDIRKRKIADFVKGMKESLGTSDVNSPFIDKEDVFNRLVPYGFHYEPDLSEKAMDKFEHELVRHQTYLHDKHKSIEAKMKNIFLKDTTTQSFDLELNMLLAIDADYEKQLLEKEKQQCQQDPYAFVRESEFLKANHLTDDYIKDTREKLNLNKPKNVKLTKSLTFEPSRFDEQVYIQRRPQLIKEMEEEARRENLKKVHPRPPPETKAPKSAQPLQNKIKHAAEDSPISLKINLPSTSQTIPTPPIRAASKPKKAVSFTSSSDDSSSDDDDDEYAASKAKKFKSTRSPSPQKERKSKSPQKTKLSNSVQALITKEKPFAPIPLDRLNNKHQPPIKTAIRKPMPPPEASLYPSMNLSNYKIPKIGEASTMLPHPKLPAEISFNEPPRPPLLPKPEIPIKPEVTKENFVAPLKIKKESLINNANQSIVLHKEKKEKHHHGHHHHRHSKVGEKQSEKHGEKQRSNSVVASPNHLILSKNVDRSQSLNRQKEPSEALSMSIFPKLKTPSESGMEGKRSKEKKKDRDREKEKDRKSEKEAKKEKKKKEKYGDKDHNNVTDSQPSKPLPPLPTHSVVETPVEFKPIKLKLNLSKTVVESPSTSSSVIPVEAKSAEISSEKKKKDKHSKEEKKLKKDTPVAPPESEAVVDNADDKVAQEAKRKRKEEKQRKKAEKRQRKLEKETRKNKEREGAVAAPSEIPKLQISQIHELKTDAADLNRSHSPGGLKMKLSLFKKPTPTDVPPSEPAQSLNHQKEDIETHPKVKRTSELTVTIPRHVPVIPQPEPSKKSKKEKKRNKKRDSSGFENEKGSNALETPPLKIQKLKIKRMVTPPPPVNVVPSATEAIGVTQPVTTPIPPLKLKSEAASRVKKIVVAPEKSEVSTTPKTIQKAAPPTRMTGQPPTATTAAITVNDVPPITETPNINRTHTNPAPPPVDLRLITDRILSRCRAD